MVDKGKEISVEVVAKVGVIMVAAGKLAVGKDLVMTVDSEAKKVMVVAEELTEDWVVKEEEDKEVGVQEEVDLLVGAMLVEVR